MKSGALISNVSSIVPSRKDPESRTVRVKERVSLENRLKDDPKSPSISTP